MLGGAADETISVYDCQTVLRYVQRCGAFELHKEHMSDAAALSDLNMEIEAVVVRRPQVVDDPTGG